jgi:16S rRNA C1402 (ribose-2'-O) methylase RsmI
MRSHKTTALYESPNRLIRTLHSIEEIFGPEHKMYVGLELTKRHERHLRDSVSRIRETLELESEGSKIKGEITMVLPPSKEDQEYESILKSQSFNPNKDSIVRVNLLTVA